MLGAPVVSDPKIYLMQRTVLALDGLFSLVDALKERRTLSSEEYELLVADSRPSLRAYAEARATEARRTVYDGDVFVRGIIEVSNYCRNDCLYCGIRASHVGCARYRMGEGEVLACAAKGYDLGIRTFVLQGGEDPVLTDEAVCRMVSMIKEAYPDCAVTLSLGERSRRSYERLFKAGADRYLLRHETADENHYRALHPPALSFGERMRCLYDLKDIGYAVGCGFMVGSPGQTASTLAKDLKFIEEFQPDMCGIGPFVAHHATPFSGRPSGSIELTCFLLSLLRLIKPNLLLPATTALASLSPDGWMSGLAAGANVVMPNLSPAATRDLYELYDGKASTVDDAARVISKMGSQLKPRGLRLVVDRGDARALR